MTLLPRWLRELVQPWRKCQRVSHASYEYERRGYRAAQPSRIFIAYRVVQLRRRCRRCKRDLGVVHEIRRGLSSIASLPGAWLRTLASQGEVWTG